MLDPVARWADEHRGAYTILAVMDSSSFARHALDARTRVG